RFEAHCFARRNVHFRAGAGVASDSRLPRTHIKDAEATEFNSLTLGKRLLHAVKNGFHGQLSLGLGDACLSYYFVNDIELNHLFSSPALHSRNFADWIPRCRNWTGGWFERQALQNRKAGRSRFLKHRVQRCKKNLSAETLFRKRPNNYVLLLTSPAL